MVFFGFLIPDFLEMHAKQAFCHPDLQLFVPQRQDAHGFRLLCAVELLVFTGRGGLRARYREVEQLLVIQTMGLDDYRGGVTLSLAAMGEADRGVTRLRADGASISAAMERIRGYSYEDELFCPHIRQLLIGEQAAEQARLVIIDNR